MIRGAPKFDGIAIGELTASFLGPTLGLEAKAAFTDSKTGETHGWTKNQQWSPAVVAKLRELRALMELDLGRLHFEGGGDVLVAPTETVRPTDGGGLGEHIGTDGIPSV